MAIDLNHRIVARLKYFFQDYGEAYDCEQYINNPAARIPAAGQKKAMVLDGYLK